MVLMIRPNRLRWWLITRPGENSQLEVFWRSGHMLMYPKIRVYTKNVRMKDHVAMEQSPLDSENDKIDGNISDADDENWLELWDNRQSAGNGKVGLSASPRSECILIPEYLESMTEHKDGDESYFGNNSIIQELAVQGGRSWTGSSAGMSAKPNPETVSQADCRPSGSAGSGETLASSGADPLLKSSIPVKRMALNDHKAGMQGLDKEKINQIIYEASKDSSFYKNEKLKERKMMERIERMKCELQGFSTEDRRVAKEKADKFLKDISSDFSLRRTIVHVDMDAFYAAVEMRDNPTLKDKPMAVGSLSMLSTSNYIARKYGVRAAMPGFIGRKLCPDLIIVHENFDKYRAVSDQVKDILRHYDPNFAAMSLDEAYLDLTCYLEDHQQEYLSEDIDIISGAVKAGEHVVVTEHRAVTEKIVNEMRQKIYDRTQLTASAGIAANTMLAKICSDMNKPNGQYYLESDKGVILNFVHNLPIRKIPGIGS